METYRIKRNKSFPLLVILPQLLLLLAFIVTRAPVWAAIGIPSVATAQELAQHFFMHNGGWLFMSLSLLLASCATYFSETDHYEEHIQALPDRGIFQVIQKSINLDDAITVKCAQGLVGMVIASIVIGVTSISDQADVSYSAIAGFIFSVAALVIAAECVFDANNRLIRVVRSSNWSSVDVFRWLKWANTTGFTDYTDTDDDTFQTAVLHKAQNNLINDDFRVEFYKHAQEMEGPDGEVAALANKLGIKQFPLSGWPPELAKRLTST